MSDLFSLYFNYINDTEPPKTFHRWSLMTALSAFLGRRYAVQHGHFTVNPNMYCMLMGATGTRKSTAIKLATRLIEAAGYETIAAEKTSKEKFLEDLAGDVAEGTVADANLADLNLFGEFGEDTDREVFISADEFNDFIGLGNLDFISLLGSLWDKSGYYRYRIRNGKSIRIYNPTVSILGGNTPSNFALCFPVSTLGQGFFARLILIHGRKTEEKITWPTEPCPALKQELIEILAYIKKDIAGLAALSDSAKLLLDKIYKNTPAPLDVRFTGFYDRRFTHLLKLCLVVSAARLSTKVEEQDIIYANTILTVAEHSMPKALGEFGKAKNSDVVHKIIQLLESCNRVFTLADIWKVVVQDLDKSSDLAELLRNLVMAEKIQPVKGGFLIRRSIMTETATDLLDYSMLLQEELDS